MFQMTKSIESDTIDVTQFKIPNEEGSVRSFGISEKKTRHIHVNQFSKWEASRQLAALCHLILRVLTRDFKIHSPEIVSIMPSESRGMKLRIDCSD
jgi:hypothetical protein